MDLGSIENRSRHIMDVRRIESELDKLTPDEVDHRLDEKKSQAAIRWEACLKSYAMLFMMLNRGNGNKLPEDSFEIRLKHEEFDGATYDTYVKIWRDRRDNSYHVKPFVDLGSGIIDSQFDTESFGGYYNYTHGTYHSKSARVHIDFDGAGPHVRLDRIEGRQVGELSDKAKAVFLAALENSVLPSLDSTEDTLAMVNNAVLDDELNPELAKRARLPNH